MINTHITEIQNKLVNFEVYVVKKSESISEIAHQKSATYDVIVACGGDGTARGVALGLKDSSALFGVLPLGSGNDFSKMLGLNKSFLHNLDVLKKATTKSIDLVSVNNTHFINTLGLGFDGLTNSYAAASKIKGSFKYVLAGMKALIKAETFKASIEIDGKHQSYTTLMIIVANGKWEGGKYFISKNSNNSDGLLELIVIKDISRVQLALEFIKLSLGNSLSNNVFVSSSFKKVVISTSSPVFVHADGELEKQENLFNIEVIPSTINTIISSF